MKTALFSWTARTVVTLTAASTLTGVVAVSPAHAAVYSTCTISRCADARSAKSIWSGKGYPVSAGWYAWTGGKYNYTGGTFQNREGQLPSVTLGTYHEYDVYARARGAARDAYRIVVNRSTGTVWFSPNHYTDFYKL
ncbi:ribonuclease domain-containing protein [Actinocorallia longicatena]|uniref:Ribonuclease domain-containing protein n=1 Tax=Actinocorallia longicatena TaxID=111803 RepID=A0ABP6QIS8_9ACTN